MPAEAVLDPASVEGKAKAKAPADVSPIDESDRQGRPEQRTAVVKDASKLSVKERFSGILGGKKPRDSEDDEDFQEAPERAEAAGPATAGTALAAPVIVDNKRASSHSPAPGESRFHEEL